MRIAFLGDVHGCVRQAVAVVNALHPDLAIQVGDPGAYPTRSSIPASNEAFIQANSAQGDIFDLLDGSLTLQTDVQILFVTGNHDDADWLKGLHHDLDRTVVPLDPHGVFSHVASGNVVELGGLRIGFLGGIEAPEWDLDIDPFATAELHSIDVLVTHDGPYGLATWEGNIQGSATLTRVIGESQPWLHVHGHYHHKNGPRTYGRTTSYALAQLVPPKDRNPQQLVADGSVGVLDTTTRAFTYVSVSHIPGAKCCNHMASQYCSRAEPLAADPQEPS